MEPRHLVQPPCRNPVVEAACEEATRVRNFQMEVNVITGEVRGKAEGLKGQQMHFLYADLLLHKFSQTFEVDAMVRWPNNTMPFRP